MCSLGRCTSSACATAELSSQSIAGCMFYTLQADNVTADDGAETTFLVTNFGVDPGNVEIDVPQSSSTGALVESGDRLASGRRLACRSPRGR